MYLFKIVSFQNLVLTLKKAIVYGLMEWNPIIITSFFRR